MSRAVNRYERCADTDNGCAAVQSHQTIRFVLSASLDGMAKLWNIEGYEEVRVLRGKVLEGHEDSILAATFNADASQIVTASRDRSLKTWDPDTGEEQQDFREGHSFLASSAVFFANGTRLVTAAV